MVRLTAVLISGVLLAASMTAATVSSVTGQGGACVSLSGNSQVQTWNLVQGGIYTLTLTGVEPACDAGNITLEVKSSITGNQFYSPATGNGGSYTFNVSLPSDQTQSACFTYPIHYVCKANAGQGDQPDFIRAIGTGGEQRCTCGPPASTAVVTFSARIRIATP